MRVDKRDRLVTPDSRVARSGITRVQETKHFSQLRPPAGFIHTRQPCVGMSWLSVATVKNFAESPAMYSGDSPNAWHSGTESQRAAAPASLLLPSGSGLQRRGVADRRPA